MRVPVFHADNHMYETREAFTTFLPDRYRNAMARLMKLDQVEL
jgi:hypothetical protein